MQVDHAGVKSQRTHFVDYFHCQRELARSTVLNRAIMPPHPQVAPCGVGFHCIIHHQVSTHKFANYRFPVRDGIMQTTARTANTNSACGRTSAHRGSRATICMYLRMLVLLCTNIGSQRCVSAIAHLHLVSAERRRYRLWRAGQNLIGRHHSESRSHDNSSLADCIPSYRHTVGAVPGARTRERTSWEFAGGDYRTDNIVTP